MIRFNLIGSWSRQVKPEGAHITRTCGLCAPAQRRTKSASAGPEWACLSAGSLALGPAEMREITSRGLQTRGITNLTPAIIEANYGAFYDAFNRITFVNYTK